MKASAIGAAIAALLLCGGMWRESAAAPVVDACATSDEVLGLSRIVEVDAAAGPQFGRTPLAEFNFLQDGEIILSFDDGPMRPYTEAVLNALDAHCTKATFFMVGRMAAADPAMVAQVARRGHTVAAHTWSHANLQTMEPDKAKDEIELGFSAVARALRGPIAPFFRFPYLRTTPFTVDYLRSRHIASFGIDADSRDFETREGAAVKANILAQLAERRRGILLFHDIQPSTARVLKEILDVLKKRRFKVVHIVAKQTAATLPNYDTMADREIAQRRVASTKEPLAERAVTWPQAAPQQVKDDKGGGETLPWARPAAASPPPAKAKAAAKKGAPWYEQWLLP